MPQKSARLSRVTTRSFTGCSTCRSRKVKCDEATPVCGQCSHADLRCGGYTAKIRFVFTHCDDVHLVTDSQCQDDDGHGRRVLYTERQRSAMSAWMRTCVIADEVDQCLADLDLQNEQAANQTVLSGPFGIFTADVSKQTNVNLVPLLDAATDAPCMDVQELQGPIIVSGIGTESYPELGVCDIIGDSDVEANLPAHVSTPIFPALEDAQFVQQSPLNFHLGHDIVQDVSEPSSSCASFLLEHYKFQTDKLFSPFRARKPPWSILHLPCALSTFAELALFKATMHARKSLLYAVLAVSAFNLDKITLGQKDGSDYWRAMGEQFMCVAKKELGSSCATELDGDCQAKYKELLMAILTIVTISVVAGQQRDARAFLLHAETLICFRGVPKLEKSRKVQMLHHIYLFLRVIEESTNIYPTDIPPRTLSCPYNKMLFPSLRLFNLRLGRDLDYECGGDFEYGLLGELDRDFYRSASALFGQIYGFPLQLLSFISRSTYLANAVRALQSPINSSGVNPTLESLELEMLITLLENDICSWDISGQSLCQANEEPVVRMSTNRVVMAPLTTAIHSAVIIFFYRCVRVINPLLVQHYVEKTVINLELFEQEMKNFSLINCGIVWPGFIAAAEALEPDLQARAYQLLRRNARTSGMRNFDVAADFVRDLWRIQNEKQDPNLTWIDLVRTQQSAMILT